MPFLAMNWAVEVGRLPGHQCAAPVQAIREVAALDVT
jgi:hypothetical protein